MLNELFANGFSKLHDKRLYDNPEEMPYLVEYICSNVPLKGLPINSVYFFTEEATNLFKLKVTPKISKIPVIVYKVTEYCFNFFDSEFNLIGGLLFSEDFKALKTYGKDFEKDTTCYRLLDSYYDFGKQITDDEIFKKFGAIKISIPRYKV